MLKITCASAGYAAGILFAAILSAQSDPGITVDQARNGSGDRDRDGVLDVDDNCSYWWNPDQKDSAGNGIGDVCRVVELAADHLAGRLQENRQVLGIYVRQIRASVWPDSCLGLGRSDETCRSERTPGFLVLFQVPARRGRTYAYRTDLTRAFRPAVWVEDRTSSP